MLANLSKILCLYLIMFILVRVLRIKPKEGAKKALYNSVGLLGDFNYSLAEYNKRKENVNKGKTFRSGKYYKIVEKMLSDLEVSTLTVEAFTTLLVLFTLIVNFVILYITHSVTLFIMFSVGVFVLTFTFLFMISIQNSNANTLAILDAEDLIISTIKNGFVNSVATNIEGIPKKVKPAFEDFLDDVNIFQIPYELAIDKLRYRLGPVFDDMHRIARPYEKNAYSGADQEFVDITNINTQLRMSILALSKKMRKITSGFAACIAMIAVVAVFVLGSLDNMFYKTFYTFTGQVTLGLNALVLIFGFAYIQFNSQGLKTRR